MDNERKDNEEVSASPSFDFSSPRSSSRLYPDSIARPKLSGEDRAILKSIFHQKKKREIGRNRGRKVSEVPNSTSSQRHRQHSAKTRPGTASDEILKLLKRFSGDREKVFEYILHTPHLYSKIHAEKTSRQVKWQIAQVAWRFGFRKREKGND